MRRALNLPTVLATLSLAGCATGPSLKTRMEAYLGVPADSLVRALGVPNREITVNGHRFVTYVRQRTVVSPAEPVFMGYGPFWGAPYGDYWGAWPPDVTVWRCETTFELDAGKVSAVSLRGNDCD